MKKVFLTLAIGLMTMFGYSQKVIVEIDTIGFFRVPMNENPFIAQQNGTFKFVSAGVRKERIEYNLYSSTITTFQFINNNEVITDISKIKSHSLTDDDLAIVWESNDKTSTGKTFIKFKPTVVDEPMIISWYEDRGWYSLITKTKVIR